MPYATLLLLALTAAASGTSVLTREWQVELGVSRRSANFQSTVCPDGWFYLTNGLRQVVLITPVGTIATTQDNLDGFAHVVATTCADDGTLYVMGAGGIVGYRRDLTGRLAEVSRVTPEVRVTRLAAGDRRFYVVGRDSNDTRPLHVLDAAGKRIHSFGESSTPFVVPRLADVGFPLWDPDAHQFLFVPRAPYQIQVYDRSGSLLWKRESTESPVLPVSEYERQIQEVIGAVRLGDGRVVTMLRGQTGRPGDPVGFLDVFDRDLKPIETTIPARFGFLIGGTADGALYFSAGSPKGLTITRVKLISK